MLFRACLRFSQRKLILHDTRELKRIHQRVKHEQTERTSKPKEGVFTVSLIGLPNCGKSTLFNSIVGERLALTDSIPGMTRDRKELVIWDGLLRLIDTAGVEQPQPGHEETNPIKIMKEDMFRQTLAAANQSNLTLLLIDAKKGITEEEKSFVQYIRKYAGNERVMLVVNKCDSTDENDMVGDVSQLGFKEIYYISAELGYGVLELMQTIDKHIPEKLRQEVINKKRRRLDNFDKILKRMKAEFRQLNVEDVDLKSWEKDFIRLNPNPEDNSELDEEQPNTAGFTKPEEVEVGGRGVSEKNELFKKTIQLCVIGRPNVGKSSLINHLIGENRMVVSEVPNTTRDSVSSEWTYKERRMKLIDTAGLSSTNFDKNPEHLKKVQIATMNHVKFSHVVIYLLDALSAMKNEDFTFIRRVMYEGRAVVLAVNKWEAVKSQFKKKAIKYLEKQIQTHLGDLNKPSVVFLSVKTNEGVDRLMDQVLKVYERWNCRVSTGLLNDWLRRFKKLDNLPLDGANQLKVRYVVQAKVRPPTFIAFVNNKDLFKDNYLRFMRSNLVQEFGLQGVAVRILLKNIKNSGSQAKPKTASKRTLNKTRKDFINNLRRREKLLDLKKKYGNFGVKS